MISPQFFVEVLQRNGIDFYTGVPDSLLKSICAYLQDNISHEKNIISANEGTAVGLAAGYYLATGKIPLVYLQNSGLGNIINPLLSLIDKEVYNIPMMLLIGWRGEPGEKDEPQHIKQGKLTMPLLDTLGIKNMVISPDENIFEKQLKEMTLFMKATHETAAFVVRKGTFQDYSLKNVVESTLILSREESIKIVADTMDDDDIVVSTTGMISRELFEYRERKKETHKRDFLTVGSMGQASQIALGISLQKKEQKVYCFDGDGALLMQMGGMPIIGTQSIQNFVHIVFNNGAHDSVGGQPTIAFNINIPAIALSSGYSHAYFVDNKEDLRNVLNLIKKEKGRILIEIKVKKGARKDLGRPTTTPIQNKNAFMDFLQEK